MNNLLNKNNINSTNDKKIIFKTVMKPNFKTTPVFSILIFFIIFFNFFLYFFNPSQAQVSKVPFVSYFATLFANNPQAVLKEYQLWRLLTFFLIEDTSNIIQAIFSGIFIYFTFFVIAFFHEIIFGSKKTFLILAFSIFMLGILQIGLTPSLTLYFYGTQYLSLILLGNIFFSLIFTEKNQNEYRKILAFISIKILIFLIIFQILKVQVILINLDNPETNLLPFKIYYFSFPLIAIILGFLSGMILDFKNKTKISTYIIKSSLLIFFVIGVFFVFWNTTHLPNINDTSHFSIKKIKNLINF